jgi:hypothetical protein
MRVLALDDQPALAALLDTVPVDDAVIDGEAVSAFTGQMFHDYYGLLSDLLGACSVEVVLSAFTAAKVRPLDVIVGGLYFPNTPVGNPVVDAVRQRVRPRCRVMRALRYMMQNHLYFFPPLLSAYGPQDVINDGRGAEGISPLAVGQVQVMLAFMQGATAPAVNTDARSRAVDYGAGTPLIVNY